MNQIKKCRICGEIASGFNYDVLSCESCKVFFCRYSTKLEKFKCERNGNCEINVSTRSKCLKCRLVKCFAAGMKKKNVTQNNHVDQLSSSSSIDDDHKSGAELLLEISILKRISEYDIKQISNYLTENLNNNNQPNQIQTSKRPSIELNAYELECLEVARNAFRYEPETTVIKQATGQQEYIDSLMLNFVVYIKKSMHFCHNFGAFNSLPSSDQLAMLKPFCHSLSSIWYTFGWKLERNGVLVVTNEPETEATLVPNEIVYEFGKHHQEIQKSFNYFNRLYHFMENDVNIRDLVTTLLLFKTKHNLLSSRENIRYHHYLYSLLLQRYLQNKHRNRKQGNRKYVALMRLLDQLDDHIERSNRALASEVGVANLPAIMRELNDLV